MSIKSIYLSLVLFIVSGINVESSRQTITLHYPPDKAVMEYDLLGISLSMPKDSADKIKVDVNEDNKVNIIPDSEIECFTVSLKPGVNSIEITATKGGEFVDNINLNVFRRSDLISEHRNPPADFKKYYFHMEERTQCTKCHVLKPREYDRKPVNPAEFVAGAFDDKAVFAATSTCYSCHNKITSYAYIHGPASVWSCLSCHDNGSSPGYPVKKPDTEVCYECHVEQKNKWTTKPYVHGPVNIGKCTICHSPHASNYPFNLYKSAWDLCVNCHSENGSGKHVLGDSFSTEGHPTRDRQDPVRIGKELTCSSCHNPHASNSPNLWAFDVQSTFELCVKCHEDKL